MNTLETNSQYPRLIPSKIVAVYVIISGLWIFFSDELLDALVSDPHIMLRIAIIKGWIFVLVTSVLLFVMIRRYVARFTDANDRIAQHQKQLRESERRFSELMERVHMIALILDTKGNITFCNDYLLGLTGWSRAELMGRNWFDVFLPTGMKDQESIVFQEGIANGDLPYHNENKILTRNGVECLIVWDNTLLRDAQGGVSGVASLGIDVTKHRDLEAQLRQAQKMESIGTLAGGVAHDFNNILTVVMSCAEMLRNKLDNRERAISLIDQILASAHRAANLTRSLLAFSRKQQIVLRSIDLNELISQMHDFLERIIGEDVEIKTELCEVALRVLVDRGQIEQVIMNLAGNARDAMPDGGRLTISAAVSHQAGHAFEDGTTSAGRYAVLTMADTGIGIARGEQERIFEPFFTTKEVGKGTGLGLSMAYGIIRQHNGWISVESEVGGGSRFMIYLPLAEQKEATRIDQAELPVRGAETILLVEDDEQVLQANMAILGDNGYHVIPARNGTEAIALFRRQLCEIDLAIIDVVMPQMNGRQVYEALMELNPHLRVLFTSGYTFGALDRTGLPENCPFIAKPLVPQEFLHLVRGLLDGNA
jgi:PAS domain S-box-containing protein